MKYLPFERYTWISKLHPEEIRRRLANNVEPQPKFQLRAFAKKPVKPYIGELNGDTFTIARVINYKNSFLPVVKGRFEKSWDGTEIKIIIRPAKAILIFMGFWLGVVTCVCLAIPIAFLFKIGEFGQEEFSPFLFIPYVMMLFGWGLLLGAFKLESPKARKFLFELFEARDANPI